MTVHSSYICPSCICTLVAQRQISLFNQLQCLCRYGNLQLWKNNWLTDIHTICVSHKFSIDRNFHFESSKFSIAVSLFVFFFAVEYLLSSALCSKNQFMLRCSKANTSHKWLVYNSMHNKAEQSDLSPSHTSAFLLFIKYYNFFSMDNFRALYQLHVLGCLSVSSYGDEHLFPAIFEQRNMGLQYFTQTQIHNKHLLPVASRRCRIWWFICTRTLLLKFLMAWSPQHPPQNCQLTGNHLEHSWKFELSMSV